MFCFYVASLSVRSVFTNYCLHNSVNSFVTFIVIRSLVCGGGASRDLIRRVAGGVRWEHGPVWHLRTHIAVVDFSVTPLSSCPSMGWRLSRDSCEIVTLADPKVSSDSYNW